MTPSFYGQADDPPRRGLLEQVDDGGIGALTGGIQTQQTVARESALTDPAIIEAARDVLRQAFSSEEKRRYLDPFAPAEERNSIVVHVLRDEVARQKRVGSGVLRAVPTDHDTLVELYALSLGWGPAQKYLDDPTVVEVKIVGPRIRVQEIGEPFATVDERFPSSDVVLSQAVLLASMVDVELNKQHPQETLPVGNGTRVHVTIPPAAAEPLVCIRRGRVTAWNLDDIVQRGTMDSVVARLLKLFSRARASFLIAGRTGCGKTALLEALANSWPGNPHVISIEDLTAEIGIKHGDWTRQMVNTQREPGAFGRVAREALRQTPDLLLPGEIRQEEAGAVLALLLSDHPVITTIHARTTAEALERFASFAALPGSYMYAGRRNEALHDACNAFDVIIKLDFLADVGRRVITEIALTAGSQMVDGALRPHLIPIVVHDVHKGEIRWECEVRATRDGRLEWTRGNDRTPHFLAEKLKKARVEAMIRSHGTSLDRVQAALNDADRFIAIGDVHRAMAALSSAWSIRREPQLQVRAQQVVSADSTLFKTLIEQARPAVHRLQQHLQQRQWKRAEDAYRQVMSNLAWAAAAAPPGGWEPIAAQIRAGLELEAEAVAMSADATTACTQGEYRQALTMLDRFSVSSLSDAAAINVLEARASALKALVDADLASHDSLSSVQALLQARRQAVQAYSTAEDDEAASREAVPCTGAQEEHDA